MERDIPVRILNSRRPEVEGTRILARAVASSNVIKSIACKKRVTMLNVRSLRMFHAYGFLQRMFEVFARYEVSVDMIATSEVSLSLTLDSTEHLDAVVRELRAFCDVAVSEGAMIALVGEGIQHTPGVAARVFTALGDINVQMLSQGASALNLGFVVAAHELQRAVERLHTEFFRELDAEVFAACA
jgi:aspartate kinase